MKTVIHWIPAGLLPIPYRVCYVVVSGYMLPHPLMHDGSKWVSCDVADRQVILDEVSHFAYVDDLEVG